MKIQIFLLICVCVFCSCQRTQKAQTNDYSNKSVGNQQANVSSTANESVRTEKTKAVDASRFSSVKINRTDQKNKFSLKMKIEYPQLKNPKTPQENKFNQYLKNQVDEQISDFINFLTNKEKDAKSIVKGGYELNLNYTINYFSDDFASIVMNWNGFSGYLNYDYFPSTINYDLKKGEAVEQKDIFEPSMNYLEELSILSRKILNGTCLSCPCRNGISAGEPLPEEMIVKETKTENSNTTANTSFTSGWYERGTEPKEENFKNWSITSEGVKITFGEYQVGPGCIGVIDIVIPFADLQPILKKNLNFK